MFDVYYSLMSSKMFHSNDLDGLKEGLTETDSSQTSETKTTTRK